MSAFTLGSRCASMAFANAVPVLKPIGCGNYLVRKSRGSKNLGN